MRERELRNDLREMRAAIDKYKDYADLGYLGPRSSGTNNWPETLEILVEGVKLPGPDGKKMRFLRRIPRGPVHRQGRMGHAQRPGRPQVASVGAASAYSTFTARPWKRRPMGQPYSEW